MRRKSDTNNIASQINRWLMDRAGRPPDVGRITFSVRFASMYFESEICLADSASDHDATPLPREIAFLENYDISIPSLREAVARAARENIPVERALIADETVGEDMYYRRLALYLGTPFFKHWPRLAAQNDPALAIAEGKARLDESEGGGWLVAPTGAATKILLRARELRLPLPKITLTTPSHFADTVLRRRGRATAHAAA